MTVNWAIRLGTAAVAITVLSVGSAWAREDEIEPVPAPPPPAATGKFDMAIGVSGTTDYQSRGITQSDSEPAIQGYVEPSYGLGPVLGDAFVNIWSSSSVDFGTGQGAEIDVAVGSSRNSSVRNGHRILATCTISMHRKMLVRTMGKSTPKRTIRSERTISLPFAVSFSSLPTTIKAALPAPISQEVGGSSCGRTLGSTLALAISSSKILMHSNSWSGLPAFPTIGNHSPSTSAIGILISATTNASSRSGFSDGCDARVVGTISLDTTWSALFRVH